MPRTPRAQEFQPNSTPRTSVLESPNTAIQSAVSGIGSILEREGQIQAQIHTQFLDEKRKLQDRVASTEFQNHANITSAQFRTDLANAKNDEDRNSLAVKRAEDLQTFLDNQPEVSAAQRDALQAEVVFQGKVSNEIARATSIEVLQERDRSSTTAMYQSAILEGDLEASKAASHLMLESGAISTEEERILKVQEAEKKIHSAEQLSISKDFDTRIETLFQKNDLAELEAEEEAAANKEGDYGMFDESNHALAMNRISQAKNSVILRQHKTFQVFQNSLIQNGAIDQETYNIARANGSLSDEHARQIRNAAPNALKRETIKQLVTEDKKTPQYKILRDENDKAFVESLVGGEDLQFSEKKIKKRISRIQDTIGISDVTKNQLISEVMVATSQALVDDDYSMGTHVGEWDDIPEVDRVSISNFAKKAARIISGTLDSRSRITLQENEIIHESLADVFLKDLNDMALASSNDQDLEKFQEERLRFYLTGQQTARIKEALNSE